MYLNTYFEAPCWEEKGACVFYLWSKICGKSSSSSETTLASLVAEDGQYRNFCIPVLLANGQNCHVIDLINNLELDDSKIWMFQHFPILLEYSCIWDYTSPRTFLH